MMALANMLLMTGVYMYIPSFMLRMQQGGLPPMQAALAVGVYGLGIFALGARCSYLVQRYRRNHVCLYAIVGVVASTALLYYADTMMQGGAEFWLLLLVRFLLGAFLGLAQMVLCSTLVIDTCESFQRTGANYAASWFSRFALSLGPALSLFLYGRIDFGGVLLTSCLLCVLSIVLIAGVKFPFKAPEEQTRKWSSDRFFLSQGLPLFVCVALFTAVVGMLLAVPRTETFYGMIMAGFVLALLSEKYAFANANLKSEVITGLIALGAAQLLLLSGRAEAVNYIAPTLLGFGTGIMGSRFLLFFIKLAHHCQRGTSQSTFFLAWELGISLGLFLGLGPVPASSNGYVGLGLTLLLLVVYNFLVHPWYMKHKNR